MVTVQWNQKATLSERLLRCGVLEIQELLAVMTPSSHVALQLLLGFSYVCIRTTSHVTLTHAHTHASWPSNIVHYVSEVTNQLWK